MNIKTGVAIAVTTAALVSGSVPDSTLVRFADRAVEYEATLQGIEGVYGAHVAHPDNALFERAYLSLSEHCTNLAALYNVGASILADDFAASGLPVSLDAAACEVAQ
jgi:hypothetical protein